MSEMPQSFHVTRQHGIPVYDIASTTTTILPLRRPRQRAGLIVACVVIVVTGLLAALVTSA